MKKTFVKLAVLSLSVVLLAALGLMACTAAETTTTTTTPTTSPTTTTTTPTTTPTTTTTTTTTTPTTTTPTTPTTTPPGFTIDIASSAGLGNFLVTGEGMTLYYFTNDSPGSSNAGAAVIANWPVFYAEDINVPPALDAADFGTITRDDGAMQTTFMDWPLYTFVNDAAPGDTNGQGVIDKWFVIDPENFDPPRLFSLVAGWNKGQEVFYYDFGANTPLADGATGEILTAPIYVLITGMDAQGNPQTVTGQHNIIDVVPGDAGYSDLWRVNLVTVPAGYEADSIRSASEIMSRGLEMTETDTLVNCPVVPPGSTTQTGQALVQGWYKGQKVYYFDYGANPDFAAPIYALITGMDAQGNPQFVDGQKNIINVIPGDEGYSAFWRVNLVTVPAGYVADTFKSAADVTASGYPMEETDIIVNCPVVGFPQTTSVSLSASNNSFNLSTITVSAGGQVTINFNNQDAGILHNFAAYTDSGATSSIFVGPTIMGPAQTTYTFTAPSTPGTYFFRCDVHPFQMTGSLVVE